ncbi:winged helix-turn-helix transcriptional regulator, partial [Bacillus sp. S34]|nr:winged helix-turn-helix transcriptional regulator [Bacillus sp. S34]
LVRRIPNPNDRRSVEVVILDAGTRTVDEVKDVYREAFTAAIPADQMGTLATLLEAFDAHGADPAPVAQQRGDPGGGADVPVRQPGRAAR